MKSLETKYFDEIENMLGELETVKNLVGVMITEFFEIRVECLTQNEIIKNYVSANAMITGIFDLLYFQVEKTREFINEIKT